MPHSKTPGGQAASDKFQKQEAEAKGLGSDSKGVTPGEAPVASDSYTSTSGIDNDATNVPGEKGNVGVTVGEKPSTSINAGNMKN